MSLANPWSTSKEASQSDIPNVAVQQTNAYAVPSLSAGDAYLDEFGWAPHLSQRTSAVETPSGQRLQTIPRRDYRPDPVRPPEEWWDRNTADVARRESVVDTTAVGWSIPAGITPVDRRWADNPRRNPPAEPRLTNRLGQNTWTQTRPLDRGARRFNGMHFSMADHRRKYDILGMRPAVSRRNTYRVEPGPWDVDVVDLPPTGQHDTPEARIRSIEVPTQSRAMRLM